MVLINKDKYNSSRNKIIKLSRKPNLKIDLNKNYLLTKTQECPISKASSEIMLDRLCSGETKEFPFSK